jgi:tight adherence protein C
MLLALPLAASAPGRLGVVVLVAAPVGGFIAPDVLLARRARHRATRLAREVADVMDLLRVAVQAGLDTGRALGEVGRRRGGLLGGELRRTARQLELGVPRTRALTELAARCPLAEIAALTAAVHRADRHGAPLAPALESLAAEARAEHARRRRDEAARAAPQIQLVVALLLVPAVMLLVAAALVQALVP